MLSMQFFLTWKSIAIKSRGFLVKEMVEIHDENEKQDMFDVKNVLASGCLVIKKCWYNTGSNSVFFAPFEEMFIDAQPFNPKFTNPG